MQKKLENIQKMLRGIARLSLASERLIEVQVEAGQWDGWKTADVLRDLNDILTYAKESKELASSLHVEE